METKVYFKNKKTRVVITVDIVDEESLYKFLIEDDDWEKVIVTASPFQGF